jgi:hypothetical protein
LIVDASLQNPPFAFKEPKSTCKENGGGKEASVTNKEENAYL